MIPVYNPDAPRGDYLTRMKTAGEFLTAYEWGPVALSDPSRGLEFQTWTADCPNGHDIYLSAPTVSRFLYLKNAGHNITELDLAFDQNGRPFFTWYDLGVSKFYWYNTADGEFQVSTILELTRSPRCTLDDHRAFNIGNSDIVLFYIDSVFRRLFCRVQRERFQVIHDMGPVDNFERLRCVGMSNQLRLQWTLDNAIPSVYLPAHRGLTNFARPVSVTGEYIT